MPTFTSTDIGSAAVSGATKVVTEGVDYDVTTSGIDIFNKADSFRFVGAPLTGDFDVVVQVLSLSTDDPKNKAGLMARETLKPGSKNVFVGMSAGDGYRFTYRTSTDGSTELKKGDQSLQPVYLRLVRKGDKFTGHYSEDGANYTKIDSQEVSMRKTIEVGLAAVAVSGGSKASASFRGFAKFNPTSPNTPTPTGTPWPLPPKAGEKWIPKVIADAPPYPIGTANAVQPGTDLFGLTGTAVLAAGNYTVSGDIKADIIGTVDADGRPTLCTLTLKEGQSIRVRNFAGVTVKGGSAKGDNLEKNGSVIASPGCVIHSCRFTGSEGHGVLFPSCDGAQMWYTEIDACKSGAWGGTKSEGLVIRGNYFHDCGEYGLTNQSKITRCERQVIEDNIYDRLVSVNLWLDNYNNREIPFSIRRNYFGKTGGRDKKDQPYSIANLRTELTAEAGGVVEHNYFHQHYSCDETRNVKIIGNTFLAETYTKAIELRNMKRGTPVQWLENIEIRDNTFLSNEATIAPSGDVTQSGQRITISGNTWPDGKQHVTVNP